MKKILIVETNISTYGAIDKPTGLWLGELIHFYDEMVKMNYEVDFVSPAGGYVPIDPVSIKYADSIDYKWYKDRDFIDRALAKTQKPQEIDPCAYQAIYYTGGHGVLWDLVENTELKQIAETIYEQKGYISAVCHGVVGLLPLSDGNGQPLLKNKHVTGFTNTEELLSRKRNLVPFSTEDALKEKGAFYSKKRFFTSYAIEDQRLITGQNPWSSRAVAKLLIQKLEEVV